MTVNTARTYDHQIKRQRVRELLSEGESLWLTSHTAVAWYLDGARIHASLAGPPLAAVLVSSESERLVTFANEADRLTQEELPEGIDVQTVPWYAPLESAVRHDSGEFLAGLRTEEEFTDQLRAARGSVLPHELAQFEALCSESAEILTARLSQARPDITERQLGAVVAGDLLQRGADPVVMMVSGESRGVHKHPLVTDAPLGRGAMVVVCARRHGMIANLTRWVQFFEPTAAERAAQQQILHVESAYLQATQAGRYMSDVFAEGTAAYARHGFEATEWQNHHQGGAAGYAGRDPQVTPQTPDLIQDRQLFAWNPSGDYPGVSARQKVEDTVIVEAGAIRPLTVDPLWPTCEVNGIARPVPLVP